jgi:hypothetical protein
MPIAGYLSRIARAFSLIRGRERKMDARAASLRFAFGSIKPASEPARDLVRHYVIRVCDV